MNTQVGGRPKFAVLWALAFLVQGPVQAQPGRLAAPKVPSRAAVSRLAVHIRSLTGDVAVRAARGAWMEAKEGQELFANWDIHTGPDSEASLAFSDGSTTVVKELTHLRVGTLLRTKDRIKIQLLLKIGELKAQVKPSAILKSDFSVRTPTATASVRGTKINRISFYPPTGVETELAHGSILVASARGRTLASGTDQVKVTPTGILTAPGEVVQAVTRVDVQPVGLTPPEVDQITVTNQPQPTTPTGTTTTQTSGTSGGTLIFRVAVQ